MKFSLPVGMSRSMFYTRVGDMLIRSMKFIILKGRPSFKMFFLSHNDPQGHVPVIFISFIR